MAGARAGVVFRAERALELGDQESGLLEASRVQTMAGLLGGLPASALGENTGRGEEEAAEAGGLPPPANGHALASGGLQLKDALVPY